MTARRPPRLGIAAFDLWTCLGRGVDTHVDALRDGRSGVRRVERYGATACLGLVDDVPELSGAFAHHRSRAASMLAPLVSGLLPQLAVLGLDPSRVGVAIGTSTGGLDRTETWLAGDPLDPPYDVRGQHAVASLADLVAAISDARGPRAVVSTACTSGAKVFAIARRWVALDLVDAVLVGASDGLCATTVRGFGALGVLSDVVATPFATTSPGMNVAEGAALFLLVRDSMRVDVIGYGESSDAHHVASPEPEGAGAETAIRDALADAGVETVDHVNAHGTGTASNDRAESRALARTLGARPLVASTKAMTGHLLGAAGAVEAAFAAIAIEHGFVPASLGAEDGPHLAGMNVATRSVAVPVRTAMSTSLAFGGSNTALILASGARA